MNEKEIMDHYRNYYRYGKDDMDEETARDTVNRLFAEVLKNDQRAVEDVLRIVREQAYYKIVVRQVRKYPQIATLDHVDNAMQQASLEYLEKSMTNFENFTGGDFYAYSISFFRYSVLGYMNKYYHKVDKKETMLDEDERIENEQLGERQAGENPEQKVEDKEDEEFKDGIIRQYIQTLEASGIKPYKLVTYCYADILPMVLKDHGMNQELLEWVNRLNIPGERKKSEADSATGEIRGLIAREGRSLIKWAMVAMHKKDVCHLSDEFTEIYNLRPLAGMNFCWGNKFKEALNVPDKKQDRNDMKIGRLVITEDFPLDRIKNWPERTYRQLCKETVPKIMKDKKLKDMAVQYAQQTTAKDMFRGV